VKRGTAAFPRVAFFLPILDNPDSDLCYRARPGSDAVLFASILRAIMNHSLQSTLLKWSFHVLCGCAWLVVFVVQASAQSNSWPTHAHDAQHSAVSSTASQPLHKIHWKTPVDLAVPAGEIFTHYGSPLVTSEGIVIVPVKTGPNNFGVDAFQGRTGKKLWTLPTGYQAPFAAFLPRPGPYSGTRSFVRPRQCRSTAGTPPG
jgi:hypothetical protein